MTPHPHMSPPKTPQKTLAIADFLRTFAHTPRVLRLVWSTSPRAAVLLLGLTVLVGLLPLTTAWVGKRLIDVVAAKGDALPWVAVEGVLVVALLGAQRTLAVHSGVLRGMLAARVNLLILDKAIALTVPQFEDSATADRLSRARREAGSRSFGILNRLLNIGQHTLTLAGCSLLLLEASPWTTVLLVAASLPVCVAEVRFSGEAFRLFRWSSPETRRQIYLETLLTREDFAKEIKAFALGPLLRDRYAAGADTLLQQDLALAKRRHRWGFALSLLGTIVLYGAFAWIVLQAVDGHLSLGAMTMTFLLFKQGQSSLTNLLLAVGGMYEDNLYVSTLFDLLDTPTPALTGGHAVGPLPGDGIRLEHVTFRYPDAPSDALVDVSLHLAPGEVLGLVGANGSGKTTLVKLLLRHYTPTSGRILLDGLDLQAWDLPALHRRMGVVFQDFVRYQWLAGENIGAGDLRRLDDPDAWAVAAHAVGTDRLIDALPSGYQTQLGKWFDGGRDLSGGEWQRVAVARGVVRTDADLLVFDEPTSAMDAANESEVLGKLIDHGQHQMIVLISHRFSTLRRATRLAVLESGRLVQSGTHAELAHIPGPYARLLALQTTFPDAG